MHVHAFLTSYERALQILRAFFACELEEYEACAHCLLCSPFEGFRLKYIHVTDPIYSMFLTG